MHKMYQTLKWLRYSSSSDWSEELLKISTIAPLKHDSCMTYGRSERELETLAITNVKSSFPFHWLRLDLQEYLSIQHIYTWKSPRKSKARGWSPYKALSQFFPRQKFYVRQIRLRLSLRLKLRMF